MPKRHRWYYRTGDLRFIYSEIPDDPWCRVRLTLAAGDYWHRWPFVAMHRTPFSFDPIQTLLQSARVRYPELGRQMEVDQRGLVVYDPSDDFSNYALKYVDYN